MRVLLIHKSDYGWGGGQTQMNRFQVGLKRAGVEAHVLCRVKTRHDSLTIPRLPRLESYLGKVTQRLGFNDVHCISSFLIRKTQAFVDADILDFHSIHSGFFSYLALPGLSMSKPSVFTLHDMWPFTGHCHNSLDCNRWKTGCGKCPYPQTEPAIRRDVTHVEWLLKNQVYKRSHLTLVTPSTWLAEQTKQSMLKDFPIHHIPHGIDTDIYRPLDPALCRSMLGILPGKKVLLFVVDNLDRYLKGADLLLEALQRLPVSLKNGTLLMLLGKKGAAISKAVDIPALHLGYVDNDRLKVICYSAADLVISPTRADNLPLVLLESLACGTPMVSFRVGGVPDIIRPGITGLLADPDNAKALCDHIVQLLEDTPLRHRMRQQCRTIALEEYSLELQVKRYIELYNNLLQRTVDKGKV
jgi:glycosyltransferase involved in cell wall biosynthesis